MATPVVAQSCVGDLFPNGIVDGADLGAMLSYWGPRTNDPFSIAADFDGNGLINGADLGALLANWGPCAATIDGLTPTQGCFVGGTQITITGTYLGTATAVTVGGVPATNLVASSNSVIATAPAGALGPATVRVTTTAGTSTAPQQFTYVPASVSSIAPNTGPAAGGTRITITGAYLALTTSVTIGGAPCTGLEVVNATTVAAVAPAGTAGNADVVIAGGKGTIAIPGGYLYLAIVVPPWATLVQAQPDPAVVTNPVLRAAITSTGLAWRVRDTGTQIEMLLVPPGTFQMGCVIGSNQYACEGFETPVHQVTLTKAYYLGRYEVTQAQWVATMGSNPSAFQGYVDSAIRPVETVFWNDIQVYLGASGMRLATEAEWEYACRAGTQTPFYNNSTSDSTVGTIAWYNANSVGTRAVGGKSANGFGFYDMLGNVAEFVSDRYADYISSPQVDPSGPASGSNRIGRGGGFNSDSMGVRSSARHLQLPPSYGGWGFLGFRVARNP